MQALASGNRDEFLEVESMEREMAEMPPCKRLVGIIVSSIDEGLVGDLCSKMARIAPQAEEVMTLGPADAPMARLRGKYRKRFLVQADKDVNIQKIIAEWLGSVKVPSKCRVQVDIDPYSFM